MVVTDTTISHSSTYNAGIEIKDAATLIMSDTTIRSCAATEDGAALSVEGASLARLTRVGISLNGSPGGASTVFVESSILQLTDSTVQSNSGTSAAIYVGEDASLTLNGTTVADNTVPESERDDMVANVAAGISCKLGSVYADTASTLARNTPYTMVCESCNVGGGHPMLDTVSCGTCSCLYSALTVQAYSALRGAMCCGGWRWAVCVLQTLRKTFRA